MKKLPKDFDWNFYLDFYQDLKDAGLKTEKDAINHYLNHGYLENRFYKKFNINNNINLDNKIKPETFTHSQYFNILKNHNSKKIIISVIITVFNYDKFICDAINSVIENDIDVEIVIVDDKSTDDSLKLSRSFLNTNHKITLIEKYNNTGLIDSRNIGISICSGEYVFILDADNTIYKNCLQEHLDYITKYNLVACYGVIDCFNEEGELIKKISNKTFNYELLKFGNYIDAMAMFNKKELIDVGGYDTNLSKFGVGWEDFELWLRLGYLNKKVGFINKSLSRYLVKEDSMLSETNKDSNKGNLIYYLNNKYNANIQ
jgi:glycosyltransferase involved in cell wall biosynthesis